MVVGAGGVDFVVLPEVLAVGFAVDDVVGAGVGFELVTVVVGAGGVDFVVLPEVPAVGLAVDDVVGAGVGLGTDDVVTAGFDSGAAGAVLAVDTAVVGDVPATGFGTDVVLPDVVPVDAAGTGDLTLGIATAGFDCGAGGVDLPENTVIFGVTTVAGVADEATPPPEPEETDPLPELTEEPLLDGLGTELTLIGFRRIVPLEPPDEAS